MRKRYFATFCFFLVASCSAAPLAEKPPAPLEQTAVDDQTLLVAYYAFDTALTAIDALRDAGVIRPGTPKAIAIADVIKQTRLAFEVADNALATGQAATYADALQRAQVGINALKALIQERSS